MSDPVTNTATFRALHVPGAPLVLFNIWDAGSAGAVAAAGAKALATGSWSVAAAHGYADGEALPFELAVGNLQRITAVSKLPVSIDLESGYGPAPADVGRAVDAALSAGAVGCNLEDSVPGDGSLRPVAEAAARVAAARHAAERAGIAAFINARTDMFFQAPPPAHDRAMADAAVERGRAYADAGADGLFVPGLADERLIERVVAASPLPVNVMVTAGATSVARLAGLGVARVSFGPSPFGLAMRALEDAARLAMASA